MTEKLLNILAKEYPLEEIDVGDMSTLKASGMTFSVKAYNAVGLGHVSVMRAKGFFGLMKMDTLIVNPTEKDLPLYSYDRIFAMGNDTLIVELYDTLVGEFSEQTLMDIKAQYSSLPYREPGEHWYDNIKLDSSISTKGKKNLTGTFDEFTSKHFEAYLAEGGKVGSPNREAKLEKAAYYVNGLLRNGGPSTDVFKKELGDEKTEKLFNNVLFGISR